MKHVSEVASTWNWWSFRRAEMISFVSQVKACTSVFVVLVTRGAFSNTLCLSRWKTKRNGIPWHENFPDRRCGFPRAGWPEIYQDDLQWQCCSKRREIGRSVAMRQVQILRTGSSFVHAHLLLLMFEVPIRFLRRRKPSFGPQNLFSLTTLQAALNVQHSVVL